MSLFEKVKSREDLEHFAVAFLADELGWGWIECACAELPEEDCDYILENAENWLQGFKPYIDEIRENYN